VVAVMAAFPAATAVTRPVELTVATDVLLLLQETTLLVALTGNTAAISVVVSPISSVALDGLTVIPVTETAETVI